MPRAWGNWEAALFLAILLLLLFGSDLFPLDACLGSVKL